MQVLRIQQYGANFTRNLKTTTEVEGWREGMRITGYVNAVTVTSKMGAAVVCAELDLKKSYNLPNYCSIFQREVLAIRRAAEVLSNTSKQSGEPLHRQSGCDKGDHMHSTEFATYRYCRISILVIRSGDSHVA